MEKVGKFELLFLSAFSDEFSNHVYFNENLRKYPPPQTVQRLGIPFLLKMQHEVLLFFFLHILLMTHSIQRLNV